MKTILVIFALLICSYAWSDSEVTIGGKTGQAHIVQEEGTSLRPRPYLNFTGVVTCADVGGKTVCDLSVSDLVDYLCAVSQMNCKYDTLADCPSGNDCVVYEDAVRKQYVDSTVQAQWPIAGEEYHLLLDDGTGGFKLLLDDGVGGYFLIIK